MTQSRKRYRTVDAGHRAELPVTGVVRMVGITAIHVAAIRAYVFGPGVFGFDTVPESTFATAHTDTVTAATFDDGCGDGSADETNVELRITDDRGDSIPADRSTICATKLTVPTFHHCSDVGADEDVTNQHVAHRGVD